MFCNSKKKNLCEVQQNILSRHLQSWVGRVTANEIQPKLLGADKQLNEKADK